MKSVRRGNVSLKDAYCSVYGAEVFIKGMHIAVYDKSGAFNTKDSRRDRKLLLRKAEIKKLASAVAEKGYTLVPLKIYFKQGLIKAEIGLCKGKNLYDKNRTIKERDLSREAERAINDYR